MASVVGCARAQMPATVPAATSASRQEIVASPKLDALLDALHERGATLNDFTADVSLTTTDTSTGEDPVKQVGRVVYQKPQDDNARLRVTFDRKLIGEKKLEQKIEYLLDGEWLTDRDYRRRIEVRRQVMQPGTKVNLLKLGEGPFPLPIGQSRVNVYDQFNVTLEPDSTDAMPHAKLLPKASTSLSRKFKSIDVWIDSTTNMPTRIETVDRNETTTRRTDLTNIKVNTGVGADQFKLVEVKDSEWTRSDEKFEE